MEEMDSTIVMINLFGAVALLLFGLAQVKDGVSRTFGAKLRTGLASGTKGGLRSFFSGFVATVALQSSTATALMVASFIERELVKPRMAQIVLLGANVGTAVTGPDRRHRHRMALAAGDPCRHHSLSQRHDQPSGRRHGVDRHRPHAAVAASLDQRDRADAPVAGVAAFIGLLDNAWPVALGFSAGIAFISSSSLAAVVLILSLASTGILSTGLIIILVLGANLGGAIPPVVASLTGTPSAKRVMLGNLIVRAIGCAVALPLSGYGGELLDMLPLSPATLPVDAHLGFNLILAVLAWPFSRLLSRLMLRLVPEELQADNVPKYLDQGELSTPMVALVSATRETLGVGDLIERMLMRASEAFEKDDLAKLKEIPSLEKRVDSLQQEVKIYLSKLGREGLSEENGRRSIVIIDYAINLEHIGDIIEKGLLPQVTKKASLGLKFSADGYEELKKLFHLTVDNLRIAQTIFVTRDFNLAKQMMEVKVEVRRMEKQSSGRHLERLRDGRIDSLQTSSLHLDMLRDLKRINAHIVSVAHPVLDDIGLLIESRLRNVG
jgi:phosphate:Na+ symporter